MKFLFLCASPFQGHLWYLSSILYVLVGIALFEKKWKREKLYWLIPVLLVSYLIFGKYDRLLLGRDLPMSLVRNEVFVGLPFFLLGDYIYIHKERAFSLTEKKVLLTVLVFVFIVTSVLETQFLAVKGLATDVEQGISTILLSLILFVLFLKVSDKGFARLQMAQIGRQYSTMIYIIHPAFLSLFNLVLQEQISKPVCRWILPPVIFMVSYCFSVIYEKVMSFKAVQKS